VFCQNFVGNEKIPSKLGLNRLNQLLNRFMIRRTHADKVMGAPIVILPRASEQIRWVKFNDVERSIYEIVRSRMIKRINKLSRSKELDANYSHVLTMLLRLRQLTGHILLVETAMRDLLETEDHEKIYELAMMENTDVKTSLRTMQLKQVRYLLAKGAKDEGSHPGRTRFPGVQERERRRDSVDPRNNQEGRREAEEDILPERDNIGGKHGIEYDFLKYLDTLREANNLEELNDRTTCVYCGDSPTDPHVTSCFHIYCEGCLENLVEESGMADQDRARCRDCGSEFVSSRACHQMDSDPVKRKRAARSNAMEELEESDSDDEMLKHHRRWRRKNDNKRKEDWIDQEGKNILPSAKTIEIKAQVLNWIAEHPHVKIIIFTQFINMIRILQKVCSAEGWAYTLYHGGINMTKRQENIDKFASEPNVRILLASLKAGGIGLNLTMAQKVIVVDPWWNSSVEQQAFCRVFRMGQEHETSLTRFVVENTVDQNMIEMQRRKQEEIDQVMDTKKSCGKR
jgi:SNF2 family DNA or RNA helicase